MNIPHQATGQQVTLNGLEVLIHVCAVATPHPRAHAPAVRQALSELRQHGLIAEQFDAPSGYVTTLLGDLILQDIKKFAAKQIAERGLNPKAIPI